MQNFDYAAPRSVPETTALLSQNGIQARILAGGTDLLVQLREQRRSADLVVDIKYVPEANQLAYDTQTGLTIGAAVACARIYDDPTVRALYPGLVDAAALIGGVQIQMRATMGGNIANASPAADSIPALIVHEAQAEIAGPQGARRVPVESLFVGPGRTNLQPGEFLVRLFIPPPRPGFGAAYLRFIPRNEMDIAVVGAGASVILDDSGTIFRAGRVALGAVAPTPLLVREAGDALIGQPVSDEVIESAAQLAAAAARPINDIRGTIAQRKHLSAVLTRRALLKAVARARGKDS